MLPPGHYLTILTGLALAGCSSPVRVAEGLQVRVGGAVFAGDPAGVALVPFEAVNAGARALYLARCGGRLMAAVDRWEDERWVQHSGDACLTVADMSPLPLSAGASRESARAIGETGRYRLRLGVSAAPGGEPAWDAASATFEVR